MTDKTFKNRYPSPYSETDNSTFKSSGSSTKIPTNSNSNKKSHSNMYFLTYPDANRRKLRRTRPPRKVCQNQKRHETLLHYHPLGRFMDQPQKRTPHAQNPQPHQRLSRLHCHLRKLGPGNRCLITFPRHQRTPKVLFD